MKVTIECLCPGKARHASDTITLSDMLGFRDATAIRNEVGILYVTQTEVTVPDILGTLTEQYLLRGITAWTLRDAKGQPIPVTRETIATHLLSNFEVAGMVGDVADDLYREAVMLPLLRRASTSSQASPTSDTTSPPSTSSKTTESPSDGRRTRRRSTSTPSRPSSITTIPTAGTETTSGLLDGDFSTSQRSA